MSTKQHGPWVVKYLDPINGYPIRRESRSLGVPRFGFQELSDLFYIVTISSDDERVCMDWEHARRVALSLPAR
jgi:hypothetical protein